MSGATAALDGIASGADGLADKLGGGEVRGVVAGPGGQFHHVEADDAAARCREFQETQAVVPAGAARNRGAGGADHGGIETVHVESDVDMPRKIRRQERCGEAVAGEVGGVEKAEATPQSDAASLAWNQMTPCGL